MVNIGDVYETTDKRRPVRRLRVETCGALRALCTISRKTKKGWTGYGETDFIRLDRLSRPGKNHFRLVRKGK